MVIEYTITVQNTGNVSLESVSVLDDIQSQLNVVNTVMVGTATITGFDGSNASR